MLFYTTSTFWLTFAALTKKNKDGYSYVGTDICNALLNMPDNILRDSNERIIQTAEYRVVKLRIGNSGQKLSKANGLAELSQNACLPGDK